MTDESIKYLTKDIPLYGTIPYMGSEWCVVFAAKGSTTSRLTGYGDFPFDRFPGLPVINYCNNSAVFQALKLKDADRPKESNPIYTGSLSGFLAKVAALGIEIINHTQNL